MEYYTTMVLCKYSFKLRFFELFMKYIGSKNRIVKYILPIMLVEASTLCDRKTISRIWLTCFYFNTGSPYFNDKFIMVCNYHTFKYRLKSLYIAK